MKKCYANVKLIDGRNFSGERKNVVVKSIEELANLNPAFGGFDGLLLGGDLAFVDGQGRKLLQQAGGGTDQLLQRFLELGVSLVAKLVGKANNRRLGNTYDSTQFGCGIVGRFVIMLENV